MRRTAPLAVTLLLLGACAGQEEVLVCPRVAAVAGLDRLDYHYAAADAPVRARLDVIQGTCIYEDGGFVVRSAVAIQLDPNRPRGDYDIPFSIAIDMAEGTMLDRAEFARIPAGTNGVTEVFEHRVDGLAQNEGARVRILYALSPDDTELQRIARERPRPPG